jgi:hypothetical protein
VVQIFFGRCLSISKNAKDDAGPTLVVEINKRGNGS